MSQSNQTELMGCKKAIYWLIKSLIYLYRYTFAVVFVDQCRYSPTCSMYALQALDKHGPWKGLYLTAKRIARCHPYCHHPAEDPVP